MPPSLSAMITDRVAPRRGCVHLGGYACRLPSPMILRKTHDQPERPKHQEEAEVQELRGQGPAEEGRQGVKVPALRRHRTALAPPATANNEPWAIASRPLTTADDSGSNPSDARPAPAGRSCSSISREPLLESPLS